jgi:hypothetical protein
VLGWHSFSCVGSAHHISDSGLTSICQWLLWVPSLKRFIQEIWIDLFGMNHIKKSKMAFFLMELLQLSLSISCTSMVFWGQGYTVNMYFFCETF